MKRKLLIALLGLSVALTVPVRAETTRELVDSYLEHEAYRDSIEGITEEVGEMYQICPEILQAIAERESSLNPDAENADCKGLCQISVKWHKDRMERLGVTDIFDEYSNVLLCADYLSELIQCGIDKGFGDDISYALLRYSLRTETANRYYEEGKVTPYVRHILKRSAELEQLHEKEMSLHDGNHEGSVKSID